MLTRFDEYLIHQTPEPLAHPVSADRNFYDRYWLSGFDAEAGLYFALGLGLYPHRQVMDAAFSAVLGGEQRACFASRRAHPAAREDTRVGPIRIEVLEPMRRLRLSVAPNDSGLEAELIYSARSACVEEDRQILRSGAAASMDVTRFTQFGCWEGVLRIDGRKLELSPAHTHGIRDRSWGVRAVGESPGGAPMRPPSVFFLWSQVFWDDEATSAAVFEDPTGYPLHAGASVVPLHAADGDWPVLADPAQRRFHGVSHQLRYVSGTRRAGDGSLSLLEAGGRLRRIEMQPVLRFQMKGAGYHHPAWKHGKWKGEEAAGSERWTLAELNPLAPENLHIQQVVHCTDGTRRGVGVLEQMCFGPHEPSGLKGMFDGAQ